MPNITDWGNVPIVFDIPMAARILGKTYDNIQKRCKRGELPAFKDGTQWRFEKETFLEYVHQTARTSLTILAKD